MFSRWLTALVLLLAWPRVAIAAAPPVRAELVSDASVVTRGGQCWLAIHLTMAPGYHTYWTNSGDSGLPTTVDWTLPEGVQVDALQWPYPERLTQGGEVDYVYTGDVYILARLHVPPGWPEGKVLPLHARVRWLVCRNECAEGGAALDLTLPVGRRMAPARAAHLLGFVARWRVPAPHPDVPVVAVTDAQHIDLVIRRPIHRATFFPLDPLVIENAPPQTGEETPQGFRLHLTRDTSNPKAPSLLRGVLLLDEPVLVSIPIQAASPTH